MSPESGRLLGPNLFCSGRNRLLCVWLSWVVFGLGVVSICYV